MTALFHAEAVSCVSCGDLIPLVNDPHLTPPEHQSRCLGMEVSQRRDLPTAETTADVVIRPGQSTSPGSQATS